MNQTAHIIRHQIFEDLGIFEPALKKRGFEIIYHEAGTAHLNAPELDTADLLVVLGAPIGVHDESSYPFLRAEKELISRRLEAQKPLLGICLGAQLIALGAGATVISSDEKEIGYAPLTLTKAGYDSPLAPLSKIPVLHWHADQFTIPAGQDSLAETPGFPSQAFTLDDQLCHPFALALQFHLEADWRKIENWLIGNAYELSVRGLDPASIRADAATYGPALEKAGIKVLNQWLDQIF